MRHCGPRLDAEAGITEQDKKIADRIVEKRKACILVVNKWDLVDDGSPPGAQEEIERRHNKDTHRRPAK